MIFILKRFRRSLRPGVATYNARGLFDMPILLNFPPHRFVYSWHRNCGTTGSGHAGPTCSTNLKRRLSHDDFEENLQRDSGDRISGAGWLPGSGAAKRQRRLLVERVVFGRLVRNGGMSGRGVRAPLFQRILPIARPEYFGSASASIFRLKILSARRGRFCAPAFQC